MGLKKFQAILSVEILDDMMKTIAASNNPVSWVIAGIKILIYSAYLTARVKAIELEMLIKKQEAEIANEQKDQEDADNVFN